MKLDIGAGANRKASDFTTVDLYDPRADVRATMWELPFPTDSVDEIWAEACLEHIARPKISPTLKEWWRVLKPETGTVTISVPDLDYVCKQWLEKKEPTIHAWMFGNQKDEGDFHRSGFDANILIDDCIQAGFGVISVVKIFSHEQEMLRATCIKPPKGLMYVYQREQMTYIPPSQADLAWYEQAKKDRIWEKK
jgi:hypothetical protein